MQIRTFTLFLALLSCAGTLSGQHSLNKTTSRPRSGDEYVKTEMEYFLAENTKNKTENEKEKKSWNIYKLKEKEKKTIYKLKIKTGKEIRETTVEEITPDYRVTYHEDGKGNLLNSENNTIYHRQLSGDSLIESGYESPQVRVLYRDKPLLMKYPMVLGDKYTTEFTGRGTKDGRLASIHTGIVTVSADAFGELVLPRGDTLFSIVRTHERKEEKIRYEPLSGLFDINAPVSRDSLERNSAPTDLIITDTYRWYEEGYRYPVFETIRSCRLQEEQTFPLRESTYIYAPYEQEFLNPDPENEKIKKEKKEKNDKNEEKDQPNPIRPINYLFFPNPVKDVLSLKFGTQDGGETIVCLYELSGREIFRKTYPAEKDYKNETIPMSAYPRGTYILRISCGSEYAAEQIVKQ